MEKKNERRMCTRTPFFTDVTLKLEGADYAMSAELVNISISGMFVQIDQSIPVGASCTIEIIVTGHHSRLLLDDIRGEVVREDEHGLAIHFISRMEWFVLFNVYTHYCRQAMEEGRR
ncbi:MAG: PilZ domain-containing protein [Proteobacteria bacterium]|nr:PilZ domain-containing protein [Pseudomonadota bacterium]MBU1648781.1 PilZ domain-containing protein [Pseudomonadota bacterium]